MGWTSTSSIVSSFVAGSSPGLCSAPHVPLVPQTRAPAPRVVTWRAAPFGSRSRPSFHCIMTSLRGLRCGQSSMTPPHFARNLSVVLLWELLLGLRQRVHVLGHLRAVSEPARGSKRLVGTVGLTMLLGIPALVVSLWLAHRLRRRRVTSRSSGPRRSSGGSCLGRSSRMNGRRPRPSSRSSTLRQSALRVPCWRVDGAHLRPSDGRLRRSLRDGAGAAAPRQAGLGRRGGLWAATMLARDVFPANFGRAFLVGGIVLDVEQRGVCSSSWSRRTPGTQRRARRSCPSSAGLCERRDPWRASPG